MVVGIKEHPTNILGLLPSSSSSFVDYMRCYLSAFFNLLATNGCTRIHAFPMVLVGNTRLNFIESFWNRSKAL